MKYCTPNKSQPHSYYDTVTVMRFCVIFFSELLSTLNYKHDSEINCTKVKYARYELNINT
jgi:hypothetical protein